jgi:CrcB protein
MIWLAIALGGAIGALARYGMMSAVAMRMTHLPEHWQTLPWGTFLVNLSGSLAIGLLYVLFAERMMLSADQRAFLVVGFLGAFTTFSTFSLDTILLIEQGWWWQAIIYTAGSLVICILGAWLGMALMRLLA